MAKKKVPTKMPATVEEKTARHGSSCRLTTWTASGAAKSIGLSLSTFIRQAVLEKAVDVERRMGRGPE